MRLLAKSNTARRKRPSLKSADWLVGFSMMAACQPRWHGVPTTAYRSAGASTNPTIAAAAIIAGVRQTVVIPLAPRRGPSRS